MSCADDIRNAQTPQEAMLVLATHIDKLQASLRAGSDAWGAWVQPSPAGVAAPATVAPVPAASLPPRAAGSADTVEVDDDSIVINLPVPSPERIRDRRHFAEYTQMHTLFDRWKGDETGFVDLYALGGPLWAYEGDRDAVMQMPRDWRALMVRDIEQDSPERAHQVARDILKFNSQESHESGLPLVDARDAE